MTYDKLKRVYGLLEHSTPLFYDCGTLCEARCCAGDEKTGMRLLPGEELLFENRTGFTVLEREGGGKIVVCSGSCSRSERPFACRIYPVFPLVTKTCSGIKIRVVRDIRAVSGCPIVAQSIPLRPFFVRRVRSSAALLVRDERFLEYLLNESAELEQAIELAERL